MWVGGCACAAAAAGAAAVAVAAAVCVCLVPLTQVHEPEEDCDVQSTLVDDVLLGVHPHRTRPGQQALREGGGQPGRRLGGILVRTSVPEGAGGGGGRGY